MIVTFVSSSYAYNEDHGEVSNIQVQLSNAIAQSLTVFYSGGEILDGICCTNFYLLVSHLLIHVSLVTALLSINLKVM